MFFGETIKETFDLLVGMHPDEATDVIVSEAIKRNISFVVCPCCVKPTVFTYSSKHTGCSWFEYLKIRAEMCGFRTIEVVLGIQGENKVLIGLAPKNKQKRRVRNV